MRRHKLPKVIAVCILAVLLLTLPVYADELSGQSGETQGEFSCYTFDVQGNELLGYWSDSDSVWYLFVTAAQSIADTDLYYTGSINETSAGLLDTENSVVSGAFEESGDQVDLTAADGTVNSVIVMQSDLPSLYITLNGTTLEEIHADKETKHAGNSVSIMDPSGTYNLTAEGSVEIKGRGNTTWSLYEKKGYQIKFDSKTSVLGMGKAKKWVLLANAGDDSLMRTQLVYRMAAEMGLEFVPSFEYIDLWIDGEYRGTYMIGEKVETGSSRLDLSDDQGAIFEHDEAFYSEEDYWFYSTMLQRHFVLKEIVTEEEPFISDAMADFQAAVDELASYLYSTPSYKVSLEELSSMIDVDSFAKYYLINEYALNRESFATSFYWYQDGPEDVIHLGPIWDFDTCMGNDGAANTESYGTAHVLFQYLLAIPEFYQRTQELLEVYKADLASMTADADVLKAQIADSAQMNYLRWDVLGKPNPKGGTDFHDTFEEAVEAVQTWLQGRETAFEVAQTTVVTSAISDDCYQMDICFQDGQAHSGVKFAVWSLVDGQDDLAWYDASRDSEGAWHYTVDLSEHNSAGMYRIDAYITDGMRLAAMGRNYVETAREPLYILSAEVSEDCEGMTITLGDSGLCSNVSFAVWSEEGSQDDLQWYPAEKGSDGLWSCSVDLKRHQSAGLYYIHAYSYDGDTRTMVAKQTANVAFAAVGPVITAQVSADCTSMVLTLENVEGYDRIWAPVWSAEGGQDDLRWYELNEEGQGTWTGVVDLCEHGSAGAYEIHIYGGSTGPKELLTDTKAYVSAVPVRHVSAAVSEDYGTMEIVLKDIGDWERVWLPVWSAENGQDDIQWYQAAKQEDGTYRCVVDLRKHNCAGEYLIHVYGGTEKPEALIGDTTVMVAGLPEEGFCVLASVDGAELTVVLYNAGDWEDIWIPVWSAENGQDDIRWYQPEKQKDGSYLCTVDLEKHNSTGAYLIHVYGGTEAPETLIGDTTVMVASLPEKRISVSAVVDGSELTVVLSNAGDWENIWIPIWSEENWQDDIQWYRPVAQADGSWKVIADLNDHDSVGKYFIHVYGGEEAPTELLTDTTVVVESFKAEPVVKAVLSGDNRTMTLTLKNGGDIENVWFPVWSEEDGMDDLQWYMPERLSDGTWQCTVDLTDHSGTGIYHIHAYTGETAPSELIAYTDVVFP